MNKYWIWASIGFVIILLLFFLFYPFPEESQDREDTQLIKFEGTKNLEVEVARDSELLPPESRGGAQAKKKKPGKSIVLPSLATSDDYLRKQIFGWKLPTTWLDSGSYVQRLSTLVANTASGKLPRRQLTFLSPRGTFKVLKGDEKIYLNPLNYRRFDAFVELIERLPIGELARILREMDPLIRLSLRQLGITETPETLLLRSFDRIIDLPELPDRVELVRPAVMFEFAEHSLESLPELEKQMLRMGPRNILRLQNYVQKLRNIYLRT